MRKHRKLAAVLSTTAVLTAFAPLFTTPVLAQSAGWVQENENWSYYDSDGYKLTDSWKKQDGEWYYLDENGNRAYNMQIDDYYVGADGKRVSNQWVSIANEDSWDSDDAPEFYWYYYGKDGKATVSKFKTIEDNWYYFDDDGRMMTGLAEIDGSTYYFGDSTDGIMKKGWVQLDISNEDPEEETAWFYFDSTGKMIKNQVDKKIGGDYFSFRDGKMVTGWYKLPETAIASDSAASDVATASNAEADHSTTGASSSTVSTDSASGYQYYDAQGKRASGWMTIEGIPGVSAEDETYQFYFKNGVPYFAKTGIQTFSINTARYAFNTRGEMQTGLHAVTLEDGSIANFYFGNDGIMKTGKQIITDEESGTSQTWFFHTEGAKKGQGYHGIRDNVLYEYGLRKEADPDLRYSPVAFQENRYLINGSGTIQKATASSKSSSRPELGTGYRDFKDSNENIWTVDVHGVIQ